MMPVGLRMNLLRRWFLLPPLLVIGACLAGCHTPRPASDVPQSTTAPAAQRSDVRFTDVAAQMGLEFRWKTVQKAPLNILEISSAGAGFIDYDADGWPDIVLVGT